jgi:hypothetical protein
LIPDSVAALVSFLLLLAPGILWNQRRARFAPSVKETALVEVSSVVLASLSATGIAGAVLLWPVWLPLFRRFTDTHRQPAGGNAEMLPYVGAVILTSALACALSYGVARARWRGRGPIQPGRVWNVLFVAHRPPGSGVPFLIVETMDGTTWRGCLEAFDTDPEDDDRGLALAGPLARKKPGATTFEPKGDAGRYVILTESQIKSIQVTYPRATPPT